MRIILHSSDFCVKRPGKSNFQGISITPQDTRQMSATFTYYPGSDTLCFASSSSGITNWNFVLLPKGTSTTITGNKYFKYILRRKNRFVIEVVFCMFSGSGHEFIQDCKLFRKIDCCDFH